jgi:cytochrome c-type biogenesis protein
LAENQIFQTPVIKPSVGLRLKTFLHAVLFVFGFSLVFIVGWGGVATTLGQLFGMYKPILGKIGGVVVIVLGLANLKLVHIPWMEYDTRPEWKGSKSGLLSSGLMGVFFAAGWTPCIGTTLGAILTLGMSQQSAGQAMILSSGYALGLGVPFLLIGLALDRASILTRKFRQYIRPVEIASGVLLIGVGLLMVTDRMTVIAIWALQHRLFIDLPLAGAANPTYLIAVVAGLLSFLSPCVLPLVPAYIGYLSSHAANGG